MWPIFSFARIRTVLFFIAALCVGVIALIYTGSYVQANWTEKRASFVAGEIHAEGWNGVEHALANDLASDASFALFGDANSASVILEGVDLPEQEEPAPLPEEETAATTTEPILGEIASSTPEGATSSPAVPDEPPAEPVETPVPDPPNTDPVVPPIESSTTSAPLPPVEEEATSTDDVASSTSQVPLRSYFGESVFADSHVDGADVAVCAIKGNECHTIEFSSFDVDEDLFEKKFETVEVKFSFASALTEGDADDRLLIRYFANGAWREAGEIYLNKEHSNAANGGYFTAPLLEIDEWDDLEGLRVVVEYDRSSIESDARAYLDALWIDTVYKDRPQDVDPGEVLGVIAEIPDALKELFDPEEPISEARPLIIPGEQLSFLFTDDVNEDALMMRASSPSTKGGAEPVYVSITNEGKQSDTFSLFVAFPDGGSVREIAQFVHNVPNTQSASSSDVEYVSDWVAVPLAMEAAMPTKVPDGVTVVASLGKQFEISPGQTLYFRLEIDAKDGPFTLIAEGAQYGDLDFGALGDESELREVFDEALSKERLTVNDRLSAKTNFDGDEMPEFRFKFQSQRNLFVRAVNWLLQRNADFKVGEARLRNMAGEAETVRVAIEYGDDNQWTLRIKEYSRAFRPGKYSMDVVIEEGGSTYVETVEFYWGVLVTNSNKSIYAPGETAYLMMAALDETGNTICDADLELTISSPDGALHSVPIEESGNCGPNNVVDTADYLAQYETGVPGEYTVTLMRFEGSDLLHRATDSFEVRVSEPFSIERVGATRIYPAADYPMRLTVTADIDFEGEFIEAVPNDFLIPETGGAEIKYFGGAKRLVWPISLKAGESVTFEYTYDAPDISPYLYLLGPAEIRAAEGLPFVESREWKLASDATGNMLLYWDQQWIPTGWTCVSCLPSDSFYQRFVVGSSTAGVNGGAATHTHTATGAVNASSATVGVDTNNQATPVVAHTHTYTPTIGSTSSLPLYRHLAVIQYNSVGEPPSIPAGAIAMFDVASSSLPSGWYRYAVHDGRYVRSESTSTVGTLGGQNSHRHDITGTTGTAASTVNVRNGDGLVSAGANAHTHTVASSTFITDSQPPYREALLARISATSSPVDTMIAMWSGDPSVGWNTVSSSSEPFENRFVVASTTYGAVGGASTSTHANVTSIPSSAPSATSNRDSTPVNTNVTTGAHTHLVDVTNFSTDASLPPYRTAVFAKRAGGAPPLGPSVHTLFESEKTGTSTPRLEFTASDPDGSDALIYQIQWDDDSDLETSPIGDRTSSNESGCSPSCFENTTDGADTSPFDEAERVRFTIQTALVSGTTYYWRVRAQESLSSTWGSWSTTTSFTYVANTNPSQWFQTQDAQFDTGTLTDVETFGSDAVRIIAETPVEAIVAYGEGVVQTPRYQIWDGDSWGGESSALDVGGVIQWVITRAGVTRDEYILGTQDASNDVNVQVYNGTSTSWGNLVEATATLDDNTARGFDIAYESQSGDALIVYCDGDADPSYRVWNGTGWVGPTTINLTSANDCEWIKLASDPVSDEIILVARDTAAGANDYEAIVWDGSAWSNATGLFGNMTDTLNEGISVEYEASGNQAVVTVSNGDTNGFVWAAWDGSVWTTPTAQALQNDFEWGVLKRDDGSDLMALCYADQSDDLGVARWDGGAWATTQEFDTAGNTAADGTVDGRPVSCEFETTAGRDGYLMLAYSNTTQVEYDYMDDPTGFAGGAALATINDSWTVSTARTGEGKILMVAFDDANTQYDFSYWNGSAWDPDVTLDGSPSVTAEPFREPVHMSARVYQPASGSITSDPIDFDDVPNQLTWGEALWNTTEPSGTNVIMQVYYGASCASLVPDTPVTGLPGNSSGFDVASSPLDLSGLSTTTYNQLCLKATLSSDSQNTPTLDDWTLSWERQPYFTQQDFRWYANLASLTPTDAWPSGATDLAENDPVTASFAPIFGNVLRLRMNVLNENVALGSGELSLRLQYAAGASCDADSQWFDVGAIGSTTAAWRGYDNSGVTDGTTVPTALLTNSDIRATYEESNDSAVNPNGASANQEIEWDWALEHRAAAGTTYCFRAISAQGVVLNAYDRYATLVTNQKPNAPTLDKPFDNEQLASTTPWFEFFAEDPESNDMTYEIEIDDTYDFSSTLFDRNSQDHGDDFSNIVTPSDRDPFTSGQTVRFIPASSLTDATTYYSRVRAKDRNASAEWSDWSGVSSVTVNSTTGTTTWHQTRYEQFADNTHEDTEATTTTAHDTMLTPGFTAGTTTGESMDFDWKTTGNAWGSLSWNDTETSSDVKYAIEYFSGGAWSLISDADLPGNSAGFDTSPVSLLTLSPTTHNEIRVRAVMTNSGASPRLHDWTVSWGYAVEQPTLTSLFDNEKTGTTTPSFRFLSTDPQDDDLEYEISFSQTTDFAASTTRRSSLHTSMFTDVSSTTDSSPFGSGDSIRFTVAQADALTNGNTYWWRVRARDPSGSNVWSVWSPLRSFTVDTTIVVSTWYQTTDEQFETDTLTDTEITGSDGVRITSTIREAMTAYAEGTAQVPRYRIWTGSAWGNEGSAVSIGNTIRFVELAAAPTRDEYALASMTTSGKVETQIFNGTTDTWGNLGEIVSAVSDATQRGFDVAYETDSGDVIAVACNGTEAMYRIWNGSAWLATSTLTLATTGNCEWIKLASDPESDEIIMLARGDTTGVTDYEAQVWDGSGWGNSTTTGSQVAANNEGMGVEYEESGGQALAVFANGAANNYVTLTWNGSSWGNLPVTTIGNDFANGRLARDDGTDAMALCYIDIDNDIGYVLWTGSAWGTSNEFEALGNGQAGRPLACEYETTAGRDGYVMMPTSDTTLVEYRFWDGGLLNGPTTLSTITDSWELRSARTGDGNILLVAYDDANTEYDFSYWDGSQWSTEQVLETTSITTVVPATIPIDIVARRYPSFTTGNIISSSVDFNDGIAPKWEEITFTDSTPGSSNILYQVEYFTSTSSWAVVPEADLPGNVAGTTTSPINISDLNTTTYNVLRLKGNLACGGGDCPTLSDWTIEWSEGIEVSGTAHAYNQTTALTSGTVGVAVNGEIQIGKSASIVGGSWTIPNVTVFTGDVVTVFIDGATPDGRAVAVTKYDGTGDVAGIPLYERHLTIGSNDNQTISNSDLALYDNSVSGDADVFHDVDGGNDLTVCPVAGCDAELFVKSGNTYRPDSASSGNVTTHDIEIDGTLTADGNTITIYGSWDNDGTWNANSSTVVMAATSTVESIDSGTSGTRAFNNLTIGSGSGTASTTLANALDIDGTLTINYGTLSPGTRPITIAGNLTFGANGVFAKGNASTTFDGSGSSTWTDATTIKQDMGDLIVNGTSKTLQLASGAKASHITIGADDILNLGGSNNLEVLGNWTNNNSFVPQTGTVTFATSTTGITIAAGSSSFYNMVFSGGGNWAFSASTLTATNDFTVSSGTVTMPTATTTIGGSFDASNGTLMHNNGILVFNSSLAETLRPGTSNNLYDLVFNGSGSWSFVDANATSSRNVTITWGTLTGPSGTLAIAGSFWKNGGTFTHGSGALRFTSSGAQTVRLGGSDAYDLLFAGSGSWSFIDTNATTTNTVRFLQGTATLPSGTFAVGGSWLVTSGAFTHNSGVVRFNSSDSGETIAPNGSWFAGLHFKGTGGWTITQNATSTATTTLESAGDFTLQSGNILAVSGIFTNRVGGTATTWTSSTLYLDSGTSYPINQKTAGGDMYGTFAIAANTDVRAWNSAATTTTVNSTASLYSQDHAGQDGDLYIWGDYATSSNEYWSYATDFDGTALGGSSRQVDVRLASGASVTYSSSTLAIVGSASATTTIANQGSGSYSFHVGGGTLNASFYSITNTDSSGLWISGSTTVSSLSDGAFTLTEEGGSSITVEPNVINGNQALQIQRVSFDESITAGSNVTATSSPSSYWWFRNHYGNFDGEGFDTDPGGDPGSIRWDDSGFTITVSGTVYGNHGGIVSSACDGSTPVVRVRVNGGGNHTGSCDAGTGAYSIPNVQFNGDPTLTVYLDGSARRAATVTRTPTTDVTGLDLYENALIVRHENVTPLTIANLAVYDQNDDSDLFFTAATGTPDTLTLAPERELFVWGGKTFTPGGNVTLESGGSGALYDGTLHIGDSGAFTATGNESHSIGGSFVASTSATFTAASSTLTFTATTSGKVINSANALTLWNATFNGSGATWSLISSATTTVQNTLSMSAGTLSGTGNISAQAGGLAGNGTVSMSAGTVEILGTGNLGGSAPWQFHNLFIGTSSAGTITKTGSGTTTVAGVLRIGANATLQAGSAPWVLSGAGTPFVVLGTFTVQTAPWYYTASGATEIADETYGLLALAPSSASPTYTILGGTLTAEDVTVGGANAVTLQANTNDPTFIVNDDVLINSGSTLVASNVGVFEVGGSWTNLGTFTHSNGAILFDSADTGETIAPGSSAFYDVEFDNSGGGWTIGESATSTRHFDLTNASSFTVSSGATLAVGGTFTNAVGGGATTWTGSTLALKSGTSFAANTKTAGSDTYGTLNIMSNTDVSMWNSSADSISVESTSSLYSQDHASVDGDLYIWGEYTRASGSDYWSYATDFDGTSLGGSSRQVDVRIASSSSVTLSGGVLDILGISTASTTIAVQGTGAYSLAVTGGTLNANYYTVRDLTVGGLALSGSPTITSLSFGDYELDINGGTLISVAASVIDANPLKIITYNRFGTSTGITGTNVTATGSAGSSWKYNLHYGEIDGEAYDSDPGGDPGFVRWDDSASQITIAGNVYSDEGTSVSSVCDSSTPVVRLRVAGASAGFVSCDSGTGLYSISDVSYNPGDTFIVYLDGTGARRASNVSVDPNTNIANMHLYENRVIVRHEDTSPLTILDMSDYDTDQDPDINFDAEDAATDTLTIPPEHKLIVWTQKTFAPAGNITLGSGGSGAAWDGTLELYATSTLSAAGTQSHSVGGNLILQNGATIDSAQSTFTMTATTTGKTITTQNASFYNLVFNGNNGNWAFSGANATTTNDFTITSGTVTLPTGTTTVGGSFENTGGTFMHNNGTLYFTSTASGKTVRFSNVNAYNLTFNGTNGGWTFADTNATSSQNVIITNGTVVAPSGTLAVGSSFLNSGTYTHSSGTLRLTSSATGRTLRAGASSFYNVLFGGSGEWTWSDSGATTTNDVTITVGSTTLPSSLAVGGSFINGGTFNHGNGIVRFTATAGGKSITASTSPFAAIIFDSSSGGWTITGNATTTSHFTLGAASSFTLTSGATLSVAGTFTNGVGGTATTWTGSQLSLVATTSYAINTKSAGGDMYDGALYIGPDLDVSMWNSAATTTNVHSTGSLYSQDHAAQDGDLYIWGDYSFSSGTKYWSYATDFDGTALGGSSRAVDVRIASSSMVTMSGGTLNIVGSTGSATTTIANQGAGRYSFAVSGGTLNANYYRFQHLDASGLNISGSPSITSLSDGDFELDVLGGTTVTLAATAIDANASLVVSGMRFATSSGISTGYNVTRTGSPVSAWTFTGHTGSIDGEAFDVDGGDACGQVRWSDSSCLFVSQSHYRWREDDGGEGAPADEWYNASWTKRKRVGITNNTATSYTNLPVRMTVDYDADMQGDFDDLRFTDSTGTTSISYFVEEVNASASSTVWVEVPSLAASDDTYIYMYYGNAGTSSASVGDAAFEFFDDFEDDDIDEYSGNTSLFNTGTTFNYTNTFGLDAFGNEDQKTTTGLYRTGSQTGQGDTIRYFHYVETAGAGADDSACTLFGVQGSGQNYAVCLNQFGTDKVFISEDVISNEAEGSGTVLASTTVDFASAGSGWYEVEVDWLAGSGGTIDVTVYDDTGAVFATVSKTSENTYTSGGVGFSYWGQHGGWDYYSVRPYTSADPSVVFGAEGGNSGATWKAAEDTALEGLETNENVRLRFSIQNTGGALTNQLYGLQYAAKGAALNCESVSYGNYADVPIAASCGSAPACMTTSSQFTNQSATAGLLSYPGSLSFAEGQIIEDPSNETSALNVGSNTATEVEYNFELTDNATQNAYCFRVAEDGDSLDNYDKVAELVMSHSPIISDFSLNNSEDIILIEGATTTIQATSTVSDANGFDDIYAATSTIYRSGVGAQCSANNNSCYQIASTSCSFSNCSGNSCTLSCSADIQYFADPTDASSTFSGENWLARVQVEDDSGKMDVETSFAVELLTLYALSIEQDIDFGTLSVGENTGNTNATTTIENTGNANIDIQLAGTNLTGGANSIAVGEQKFATTTFAYSGCAICQFLTGSAANVEVDLPKPTSTTTVSDDVYWGINIPTGTGATSFTGTNTFWAVGD